MEIVKEEIQKSLNLFEHSDSIISFNHKKPESMKKDYFILMTKLTKKKGRRR